MPSFDDSQGLSFTFDGDDFYAKNVKVKKSAPTIDATDLSVASGSYRVLQGSPIKDPTTVTLEFFGSSVPTMGARGTISCAKLGLSGDAYCEESEVTAAVGELLMGTATFRISG